MAITTAPRARPTLGASLASLRRAGFHEPVIIVADGAHGSQEDFRCAVHTLPVGTGIVATWVAAVRALLESQAPYLMVMQDDVTWPERSWLPSVAAMARLFAMDPDCGYASLHTMPRVQSALEAVHAQPVLDAWYETGPLRPHLYKERWCGAQCWTLSRASAEALLADPSFAAFAAEDVRGFDHEVTATLNRLQRRTYTWWPSLLSHELGKGNRAPRQRSLR